MDSDSSYLDPTRIKVVTTMLNARIVMGELLTALAYWDLCGSRPALMNNLEWVIDHFSIVTAILSNLSTLDETRRIPKHQRM